MSELSGTFYVDVWGKMTEKNYNSRMSDLPRVRLKGILKGILKEGFILATTE